jgi:predicted Rossmann fold flavoprotein
MVKTYDVAVVGGGAAGLAAAVSAARSGSTVVICERLPKLGKKILATGGGRCNLLNRDLSSDYFTSSSDRVVSSVFERFGKERILAFFRGLGLETVEEGPGDGRIFPITNQASSVLRVLEIEIRRLGVAVETGFEVATVGPAGSGFSVETAAGGKIRAGSVILAGGGKAYPALGSNGSGYALAAAFGHGVIKPVPSAVPLLAKDRFCHLLQGQRIRAAAAAIVRGKAVASSPGEVLFTQYGLSGTAILDISESLSIALNRDGATDVALSIDLVPRIGRDALALELERRLRAGWARENLAAGLLPDKFATVIAGLITAERGREREKAAALAGALKDKRFDVLGTRGWNEAEFTAGGIDARDLDPRTLESRFRKKLYIAGEILDVQGKRGGYNLAWAWASGTIAGLTGREAAP